MKTKSRLFAGVLCLIMFVFCALGLVGCSFKKCSHQWGGWSVKTQATCSATGQKERKCSKCGEKETATIGKLAHDWESATCSTPKTCKNCSQTEGSALPHDYSVETANEETLHSAATCTSGAIYYKSCSCGDISLSDEHTFIVGAPLEHVDENKDHLCDYGCGKAFGECVDSATDNDHLCDYGCNKILESCKDAENDGNHVCDVCGAADVTEHNYAGATCGMPATCVDCGSITSSNISHEDKNFDHICDNDCGNNQMGAHADSSTDDDHVCDYGCGVVLESCVDVATDDDHDCDVCGAADVTKCNFKAISSTSATCEAPAKTIYQCDCGEIYEEIEGDALGHDISGVEPIETKMGDCEYHLVYICKDSDCQKEAKVETEYRHDYVASITKAATCVAEGEKTLTCSKCGHVKPETETIEVDTALGHKWVEGTVDEFGKRTDTCELCRGTKTTIVATSNSASSSASDLADADLQLKVDEETSANIQLGQGVADAIGDKDITVSADVVSEDTLKDMGVSEEQLSQIGANTVYDFNIKDDDGNNISNFGENNFVTITLPYVLKDGEDVDSIAVWFISDSCQKEDCDKGEHCVEAHKLVSIQATYNNGFVTFQTNHFSIYTVTRLTPAERCALYNHVYVCQHVDGSCTQDEYDLYVCVRCHDKYIDKSEGKYIVADGHDYEEEIKPATCDEHGYKKYTCSDCGHNYTIRLNATGHAWEIEQTVPATCKADGFIKYICANSNCGLEYTEVLAKLPHVYTNVTIPATCTSSGYTSHECDNCGYKYIDEFVEAKGHTYVASSWTWAADYSSAILTLVCDSDSSHVITKQAVITKTETNGACSTFVQTDYLATVSYNGTNYTDEKTTQVGSAKHDYAKEWSSNEEEHWRECVCGAKTNVVAHEFTNEKVTKKPTCSQAGESVATCKCGATKIIVIPATGEHQYENGKCKNCGATNGGNYFVNLVDSWKDIKGFVIKVENVSIEVKEDVDGEMTLEGSIKQIDVAELCLYVEDGEIGGAARGSLVIFNGPIIDANAVMDFKAVIEDGYVYAVASYGAEGVNPLEYNIKLSVDACLEALMAEVDLDDSSVGFSELTVLLEETLIPTVDKLVELNSNELNACLESMFNMIFTFEKQKDGSVVAVLDYNKLELLAENLSTKNVSEFIDVYFGQGSFQKLVKNVYELLTVEIDNLPEYLDGKGLDSAVLISTINEMALSSGAPEDFDLAKLLESELFKDVTLGEFLFECDKESFETEYNQIIEEISTTSIRQMMGEEEVEEIKQIVDEIINTVSESANISFATTSEGGLKSINLSVKGFNFAKYDTEANASLDVSIIPNGRIDVSWTDIIEKVENGLVNPPEEMLDNDLRAYYYSSSASIFTFQDEDYYSDYDIEVYAYKPNYEEVAGQVYWSDCSGWTAYELGYNEQRYSFRLCYVSKTDDYGYLMFMMDKYGEIVKLVTIDDSSMLVIYEDGTEKTIVLDIANDSLEEVNHAIVYAKLGIDIFGEDSGKIFAFGEYVSFYYNPTLKEYAYESKHNYEYQYDFINGVNCDDGVSVTITCNSCDYENVYTSYWHLTEYREIFLSDLGMCGGYAYENVCGACGKINDYGCNDECSWEYEGSLEDGSDVYMCYRCGAEKVQSRIEGEKDENCRYEVINRTIYYLNEQEIYKAEMSWENWEHNSERTHVLKNGEGSSCEDGVTIIETCKDCGYSYSWDSDWHETCYYERIDLTQYGACYGEYYSRSCACGRDSYTNIYSCGQHSYNEYYEGDKLIHVQVRSCSECGLRYTESYYEEESQDSCKGIRYYTKTLSVGTTLLLDTQYTEEFDSHDILRTYALHGGEGSSCDDGVTITETCKKCDYYNSWDTYGHAIFEKERIDLSQYGSVCGGYAVIDGCACGGYENSLSIEHSLCDFGYEYCPLWVEGAIMDGQYSADGWSFFSSDSRIYTCAVTDPAESACAFKIRYASYWFKEEGSCIAYYYKVWQFGYDENTDTYQYEVIIKTKDSRAHHNYVDNSEDQCTKWDCPDCGSYYHTARYYNEEGILIKEEVLAVNTQNVGSKSYELINEFSKNPDGNWYQSRDYIKRVYQDGSEEFHESIREENGYQGPFGEDGRLVRETISGTWENHTHEYAYVNYKGYSFNIYEYYIQGEYNYRYDYSYSFENGCIQTVTYVDSDGEYREETRNVCKFHICETVVNPTCSQDGKAKDVCEVCGKCTEEYSISAHDHDWVQIDEQWYYCFTCGLENANGVSGGIIMEDLTDKYGNGEFYVVGYKVSSNVKFGTYVSLILEDDSEVIITSGVNVFAKEEVHAFAFSKAEVEAWATQNGYANYKIKFVFAPDGADGSFDYAITFTENMQTGTISNDISFVDYIVEGDGVSYTIVSNEDTCWSFTSASYNDTYAELYDSNGELISCDDDGGANYNFLITYVLNAGETYTLKVRWLSSDYAGNMALIFTTSPVIA